jgi:DNA-binding response OmpR family regulator
MHIPVLLLTAKDTVADRVLGLDSGSDDYLVKPFAFAELSARVRALVRRGKQDSPVILEVDDLRIDLITHKARRGNRPLQLTTKEYEVLEYLMRQAEIGGAVKGLKIRYLRFLALSLNSIMRSATG